MAFLGAGKLNGVAKRSHGVEQFVLTSSVTPAKPLDIYSAIPGTGALTNATGPQAVYGVTNYSTFPLIPHAVSQDGVWMVQYTAGNSYNWIQFYQKVNGVYQLGTISTTNNPWPGSPGPSSMVFFPNTGPWWNAGYYALALVYVNNLYFYTCPIGSSTWTFNSSVSLALGSGTSPVVSVDPGGVFIVVGMGSPTYLKTYYTNGTSITNIPITTSFSGFTPTTAITSVAFSPQNNLLALGQSTNTGTNRFVNLFNYTTDEISNISFTRTPLNVGSAGTVYQLAFNNTSSGVITTSSLAFVPATTPPTVVDLQLNGASTVAINTTTIGATGFSSIAWDPTGAYLAVGTQQLNVYNRVGDTTYNAISTGSYYSPSTGYIPNMTWNTTTNVLNFLGSYAPYIFEYGINTTTNTLTPLDSWGRVSAGFSLTSTSTAFIGSLFSNQNPNFSKLSPDGSLLVNGSATSPYFQASYYDYLNTNQVTPLTISSATTLTSSGVQNAFWSPNGRILTLLGTSSPYINNYYISGTGTSTVFTRLPQPVDPWGINPLTNSGYDGPYAAWSPDSSILVVSGSNTTPYVMFYSVTYTGTSATITRGTSTHFSSIPTGVTYSSSFSPDGKILAIGGGGTTALTYNVTFNGTQTNFLKFISTLTQASTPLVDLKWSNDNNWLGTIYGNSSQRAAYIYRRTTVGTATNFTLTSPAITDPVASDVFWRGQFSNDSSKFYLFEEAALSASINSTVSALNYSSQSNTWTYTTTSVTIDMPLPSGNIDWRVDI